MNVMSNRHRWWLVFLLAAHFRQVLLGQNVLVAISPHPLELRTEFAEAFSAWHLDHFGAEATIEWHDVGGASEAQRFVESEFRNKRMGAGIGIDVFFGGGTDPFLALARQGLLVVPEISLEALREIPKQVGGVEISDPKLMWYGSCLASFGILQNQRVRDLAHLPRITRWEELAKPEVFGWVGAADARNSGAMNAMYEAVLQAKGWKRGWELLTEIAGNTRQFDRFGATTAKECVGGQTAFAFCVDYFGFMQIDAVGATNMEFVLPEDFTLTTVDAVAQLRNGPHPVLTGRFISFVLSEAGQRLWYLPKGHADGPKNYTLNRLPVRPQVYSKYRGQSSIRVNPFEAKQAFQFDSKVASARRDIVRALHGAMIVDNHSELVRAWRAILSRGTPAADMADFGSVPITAEVASQLAATAWSDPSERQRIRQQWQRDAAAKYRRLAHQPSTLNSTENLPQP